MRCRNKRGSWLEAKMLDTGIYVYWHTTNMHTQTHDLIKSFPNPHHILSIPPHTCKGRDELGTGKLVYSSVPDFDHHGLPRLWQQSRREVVCGFARRLQLLSFSPAYIHIHPLPRSPQLAPPAYLSYPSPSPMHTSHTTPMPPHTPLAHPYPSHTHTPSWWSGLRA